MEKVSFTQMKDGTKEDYLLLDKYEKKYIKGIADRLIKFIGGLSSTLEGYQVSRLEHSLQTATRAFQDKAEDEMIIASLFHDIGDELAPLNHAEYAAAVLKPYVSEKCHWIVEKHGEFQMYYYAHHLGGNKNQREGYKRDCFICQRRGFRIATCSNFKSKVNFRKVGAKIKKQINLLSKNLQLIENITYPI